MKINFNNNLQRKTPIQFRGNGIDYTNNWQSKSYEDWRRDIINDLSEGAKLYFEKNKAIDDSVTNLHYFRGLSIIFELTNNEILKVSLENPLEYRKHQSEFDIPFLSSVEQYGKTYIVKEPKANTDGITRDRILDIQKRIRHHGYEMSENGDNSDQYGLLSDGKVYLLDTRCAMPMPNRYTIIVDKISKRLNKCCVSVSEEQLEKEETLAYKEKGYFAYHINETPRRNLTFKEGLSQIFNIIKNNIKYRKRHFNVPYDVVIEQRLSSHVVPRYCKVKKIII